MRTKLFIAGLMLFASTNLMAYKYLTVTYTGSEENILLPTVKKIYFLEDRVKVETTEGSHSYPYSVFEKISFTESADAINAMPEQAENLTFKDGTLAVKGDGFLRIYGTNGALVSIANVKEGANISLSNLPAGVYIVNMNGKTIKVRK